MRAGLMQSAAFLDLASVHPSDLDLKALTDAVPQWRLLDQATDADLDELLPAADVLVTNKFVLDEALLARAPRLKLVCIAATGTNNVDLAVAKQHGIAVCNVTAYATPAVVQHVFALLLSLTVRLQEYTQDVKSGEWSRSRFFCLLEHPVRELAGRTLGIYGYGELGRGVARVAEALGMRVLVAKRNPQDDREGRVLLQDMLSRVDVLTLHCPLTDDTRGLIGRQELASMKRDAVLINTARGGLVDEAALLEALTQGRIGGAGLDVLATEPPAEEHPLLKADLPNLVISPHTAWASRESRQRLVDEIALNIEAFKEGSERNRVC